jgi:hypothetical protein
MKKPEEKKDFCSNILVTRNEKNSGTQIPVLTPDEYLIIIKNK